jgi:hypothetical protein
MAGKKKIDREEKDEERRARMTSSGTSLERAMAVLEVGSDSAPRHKREYCKDAWAVGMHADYCWL